MKKAISIFIKTSISIFFSLSILFFAFLYKGFIVESDSPSIEYGLYLRTPFLKIKEGKLARFSNPLNERQIRAQSHIITKEEIPYDYFIKRVAYIDGDLCYMIGNSSYEIKKRSGIENAESFDSRYYGLIEKGECERVVYLKHLSRLLGLTERYLK